MNRSNNAQCIISVSAAVSALLYCRHTYAQDAPSAPTLTEVVVTATRRSEKVSDVPYNITAVTSDELERSGIDGLAGLSQGVAGLEYIDQGPRTAGSNDQFILRGLNANAERALDGAFRSVAPVSTYLGETPLFLNLKMFDMERVEILRGPQGTLYGSGSLGGTIRFIPKSPVFDEFHAQGQVALSSTQNASGLNRDFQAMFNVPLTETFAFRLSGGEEHLAGFIDETNLAVLNANGTPEITGPILSPATQLVRKTQTHTNASDVKYARAALAARFSDSVRVDLHYNYQHSEVGDRQADNTLFSGNRSYEGSTAILNPQESKTEVLGLDVEADFGFATLTSATSYYDSSSASVESDGGVYQLFLAQAYYFGYPRFVVPGRTATHEHAAVQELRLTSKGDNRVDWLLGGYYENQKNSYSLIDAQDKGLAAYVAALNPFQTYFGTPTPSIAGLDLFDQAFSSEYRDTAAFGELTWHITKRWQVTGGARRFWQKDDSSQDFALPVCQQLTFCGPPTNIADVNSKNSQIFRANTSFKVDERNSLYFTWAQGFRHGGSNALPPPGTPQSDPRAPLNYLPDTSTNWELGLKGTVPEAGLSYALAAYYIKWKNFQFDSDTSLGFSFVGNGPQASSRGVEAEVTGRLWERFIYSASYAYVDAKVDKTFSVITTANAGDPLPGVPANTASVALDYSRPVHTDLSLTYHIDGSYRDKAVSNFNPEALSYFAIRPFSVWNAALILSSGTRWNARLFADNLFSEAGRTGGSTPDRFGDEAYFYVKRPLTVGVRLKVDFE